MKLDLTQMIEFEKKYDLKNRKILNMNYWDFCRMNIFYELKSNYEKTNLVADICKKIKIKDRKLNVKYFKNYFFGSKKNLDLLFISDPRRTKQNNLYESTFIDSISNYLKNDYSSITIEEPSWRAWGYGMPPHFSPTNSINLKYTDVYELNFIIKERLFKLFNKTKIKSIENELEYLYNIINSEFKVDISYTKNVFTSLIIYFIIMGKKYLKLIKKLNPKIVLLNYRPTYFKVLINSICRANNIPTVDLQHGVILKEDPLERKNPNGYDCLSTSDYLFAYGEKLVDKSNLCFFEENIKYVGFPFLEKKYKGNIKRPEILENEYKYILIISQSIAGEKFAEYASKLADLLKTQKEYKIIFKYHPNELTKNFKCLEKSNIIEIKNLNYEIYQFQKYSYCQIGAYSTGLYEGLKFQLPTIILENFPGAKGTLKTLNYIKKGVYVVKYPRDILNILDKIESPSLNDINLLWKNNSLENIKKEIEKIIKKNYKL